ncbi:MAG: hypothetical protein VKK42_24810 [Lyngbya sp.]|nr:hypothetical protein [Lyngbya sp.]
MSIGGRLSEGVQNSGKVTKLRPGGNADISGNLETDFYKEKRIKLSVGSIDLYVLA